MVAKFTSKKVVLLEDSALDAQLIERQLEGFNVVRMENLTDTLSYMNSDMMEVDVILIDLDLPDSYGINTFIELNKVAEVIPKIILTSLDSLELTQRALLLGAQDFVLKNELLDQECSLSKKIEYAYNRQNMLNKINQQKNIIEKKYNFKKQFISNFSHEIRTPLNAISSSVELLDGHVKSEEGISLLDTLKGGTARLLEIVNEILDQAKVESGKIDVKIEKFDIRELVESIVRLFGKSAKDNKVMLSSLIHKQVPKYIYSDRKLYGQLISNLTGNALKFTKNGSVGITVNWDKSKKILSISFSDTGCGISEDDLTRLFLPFTQFGSDENQKKGTGLGLSICKNIVESLGGTISARSKLKEGTTFVVQLPINKVQKRTVKRSDFSSHVFITETLSGAAKEMVENYFFERDISFVAADSKLSKDIWSVELDADDSNSIKITSHENTKHSTKIKGPFTQSLFYQSMAKLIGEIETKKHAENKKDFINYETMKILVVDDAELNVAVLKAWLKKYKITPDIAKTGEESLQMIEKNGEYDLILLDYELPDMTGFEVYEKMLNSGKSGDVALITGHIEESLRRDAINRGMISVLMKPVEGSLLGSLLDKVSQKKVEEKRSS